MRMLLIALSLLIINLSVVTGSDVADWYQDAGNAQRTGYTSTQPGANWQFLWSWNGPDENGGTGDHFYDVGHDDQLSPLWEGRTVAGPDYVYVPALSEGLYALNRLDGSVAWHYPDQTFRATPAFEPISNAVFAGTDDGSLLKFDGDTGQVLGQYEAGSPLNKSTLISDDAVFIVTQSGQLHKINAQSMTSNWIYDAGSNATTPPAYSASRDSVIYATQDLYVQAVSNATGALRWRVKPSVLEPDDYTTFEGYWPVIADESGIVFLRMNIGGAIESTIFNGPGPGNKWPTSNAEIRAYLTENPAFKNLFALDLDTGDEAFIPAVGPGGTEARLDGVPILLVGPVPVIKALPSGKEVAYIHFRNGQTREDTYDGRWDSHLGEMVLDDDTVPGYTAGDLRFVQFARSNVHISDEQNPLTMAGDTVFHAHWGASESMTIVDRRDHLGDRLSNPITSSLYPMLVRRQQACPDFNPATHRTSCGLTLYEDGRYWDGPGFWTYWDTFDPPTILSSLGILPRYTYVTGQLVITQGNGGELMIFQHSGAS